ncbi:TraR/DksA family transcriptional regulator [Micromonospora sonneratiae]|uniref:TraR/DksA family transcriptional regulator n=1 Tax=Micromonospora sonneratiae TaxID=1184706 RepID=A0ABW3YBR5_9ACTN
MSRQGELGVLRMVLQEQYERHTTQLALLDRQAGDSRCRGGDADTAATLTAASRQALGDIARALHYLDHGAYGVCQRCQAEIPIERLAQHPAAGFCASCEE